MNECPFESAALRAVRLGMVDAEMQAHASSCVDCADLIAIAGLLGDDRRSAMSEATLPSSGALWFAMQLRARRDSAHRSRRLVTLLQLASLLAGLAIAIATLGAPDPGSLFPESLTLTTSILVLVGGGAALLALFTPVAIWLALGRR